MHIISSLQFYKAIVKIISVKRKMIFVYDPFHLGWVFGLTTENAENASRLRAESVSSMSSFASSESSSTRDKLNKLRYSL